MKLLASTKNKITKGENSKNVAYLGINYVVLITCNIVNNSYQQNSRSLFQINLFWKNRLVNY